MCFISSTDLLLTVAFFRMVLKKTTINNFAITFDIIAKSACCPFRLVAKALKVESNGHLTAKFESSYFQHWKKGEVLRRNYLGLVDGIALGDSSRQ